MLEPHEVAAGMAFPADYIWGGTRRERVKLAGNAVTPPAARDLIAASPSPRKFHPTTPLPAEDPADDADLDVDPEVAEPDQPDEPELPAHDGTPLGRDLAELEATDPAVAQAAARLEDAIDRIGRPEDHVRPEHLQVDLLDLRLQHATTTLTRAHAHRDPLVGILRSAALSALAALDLYLELHTQTPAAPTPHTTAPRATPPSPPSPGLDGSQPAADPEGEAGQQPARFQTYERTSPRRPIEKGVRDELVRRYLGGETLAELGHEHHISPERVGRIVREAGHPTRRVGGPQTRVADRLAALGVTHHQVKTWAVQQGLIPEIPRGVVQTRLIDAYAAAHPTQPTGQSGDTA
jgi:hypothetical protein